MERTYSSGRITIPWGQTTPLKRKRGECQELQEPQTTNLGRARRVGSDFIGGNARLSLLTTRPRLPMFVGLVRMRLVKQAIAKVHTDEVRSLIRAGFPSDLTILPIGNTLLTCGARANSSQRQSPMQMISLLVR